MIPKTLISRDFFLHLTHLFYAVSFADKRVDRQEKLSIIKEVETNWSHPIKNENSQSLIYDTMKKLIRTKSSPTESFEHFKIYYNKKKDLFTNELKAQMLVSLENVARSFAGVNKSELIMLNKIKLLLKYPEIELEL